MLALHTDKLYCTYLMVLNECIFAVQSTVPGYMVPCSFRIACEVLKRAHCIKGISHDSIFQISFFPHFADFVAV